MDVRYTGNVLAALVMLGGVTGGSTAYAGPTENFSLIQAAGRADIEGVKAALLAGAFPNSLSGDNPPVTPLKSLATGSSGADEKQKAARRIEICAMLFESGATLGPYDDDILQVPVMMGEYDLVALLLKHGAAAASRHFGYTPPELAIKYDKREIYDMLIANGGEPVSRVDAAQISLNEAVAEDDNARMHQAIADGANVNSPDAANIMALMAAVDRPVFDEAHEATIRWLIRQKADLNSLSPVDIADTDKELPLNVFVDRNIQSMNGTDTEASALAQDTLKMLLHAGAHVSGRGVNDRTPLHWAALTGNLVAAEILINEGSKLMDKDRSGKTPLSYAEDAELIKLLKAHGAAE